MTYRNKAQQLLDAMHGADQEAALRAYDYALNESIHYAGNERLESQVFVYSDYSALEYIGLEDPLIREIVLPASEIVTLRKRHS